jgi:hypothetical protein
MPTERWRATDASMGARILSSTPSRYPVWRKPQDSPSTRSAKCWKKSSEYRIIRHVSAVE